MAQPNDTVTTPLRWLKQKIVGTGLKTRLLNPHDTFWDLRLGVNTLGYIPAVGEDGDPDYRVHYQPTSYAKLFRIFRRLELSGDDAFVDFGCGLGRPVFAASWAGARKSIGVEIDEGLASAAEASRARSRLQSRDISFINLPAQNYTPAGATIIYLFHPFGPGTLQEVVDALLADIHASPRRVRIAYENPVHGDVFESVGRFRKIDEWPADKSSGSIYAVQFWEAGA